MFQYLSNCFWLVIPVLLLNLALASRLPGMYQPEIFSAGIPRWLEVAENASRTAVFLLPLLMQFSFALSLDRTGAAVYGLGFLLYAGAWFLQIRYPASAWSRSRAGFMAPAYTPAAWLAGIALLGSHPFVPLPGVRWFYAAVSVAFLACHNLHAWIVYSREARAKA